jgi:hypothetical protein
MTKGTVAALDPLAILTIKTAKELQEVPLLGFSPVFAARG